MTDKSKEFSLMLGKVMENCSTYKTFIGFNFSKNVQSQLQYMLGTKYTLIRWIERFCVWARSTRFDGEISSYSYNFDSFEQLWLAFVMKEKYSKQWNGKEWITIKRED